MFRFTQSPQVDRLRDATLETLLQQLMELPPRPRKILMDCFTTLILRPLASAASVPSEPQAATDQARKNEGVLLKPFKSPFEKFTAFKLLHFQPVLTTKNRNVDQDLPALTPSLKLD